MSIAQLVLYFALFLFSVVVHEVAHGVMANRYGDNTAVLQGRITLNPIRHIDPIWTIAMPLLFYFSTGGRMIFGGAKPVPVNPYRFRNMRRDMMWVALAGPLSNLLLACAFAAVVRFCHLLLGAGPAGPAALPLEVLKATVFVNLFLMCFNLIPVPPLDGGRVLCGLVPRDLAQTIDRIEPYGLLVLIVLLSTGVTRYALLPAYLLAEFLIGGPL